MRFTPAPTYFGSQTHDYRPPLASPATLPLFFPPIDDMDTGDGSLTGFDVTDLFGTSIPFDQHLPF